MVSSGGHSLVSGHTHGTRHHRHVDRLLPRRKPSRRHPHEEMALAEVERKELRPKVTFGRKRGVYDNHTLQTYLTTNMTKATKKGCINQMLLHPFSLEVRTRFERVYTVLQTVD